MARTHQTDCKRAAARKVTRSLSVVSRVFRPFISACSLAAAAARSRCIVRLSNPRKLACKRRHTARRAVGAAIAVWSGAAGLGRFGQPRAHPPLAGGRAGGDPSRLAVMKFSEGGSGQEACSPGW